MSIESNSQIIARQQSRIAFLEAALETALAENGSLKSCAFQVQEMAKEIAGGVRTNLAIVNSENARLHGVTCLEDGSLWYRNVRVRHVTHIECDTTQRLPQIVGGTDGKTYIVCKDDSRSIALASAMIASRPPDAYGR